MKKFLLALILLAAAIPSIHAMEIAQEQQNQGDSLWLRTKRLAQTAVDLTKRAGARINTFCDTVDRKLDQFDERTKRRHARYWQLLRTNPLSFVKVYFQDTVQDFNRIADAALCIAPFILWYIQTHPEIFGIPHEALMPESTSTASVTPEIFPYDGLVGVLDVPQLHLSATFVPAIRDFVLG